MPSLDTQSHKNRALALLALTQFMIVIDASITNVALPTIGRDLHINQTDLSWIVNAYTLTFGGFLLLGGRLADLSAGVGCSRSVWPSSVSGRCSADWPAPPTSSTRPARSRESARRSFPGGAVPGHDDFAEGPSATVRSASGARSPVPAEPSACCSAAS